MKYLIRFDFPQGDIAWAAKYSDGLGFSWTQEGAMQLDSKEVAERFIVNGYGSSLAELAQVVEVPA